MSRGLNKVMLIGNVGNDPEMSATGGGSCVAKVSIATSETWKDKATGEQKEKTDWHNVVFFGRLAEIVGQYAKKGSKIYVEGKLRTRKWKDANSGADRSAVEIEGREMQFLDSRPEKPSTIAGARNGLSEPASSAQVPDGPDPFDDDIPF